MTAAASPCESTPGARTWLALGDPSPSELQDRLSRWLRKLAPPGGTIPFVHGVLLVAPPRAADLCAAVLAVLPTRSAGAGNPPTDLAASASPSDWPAGLHRLCGPGWTFTLCVGATAALLPQLSCQAHRVWLWGPPPPTLPRFSQTLARLCARDALLSVADGATDTTDWLKAGFASTGWAESGWAEHRYRPRWPLPATPQTPRRHALVLGAGLAGAAVAASLTHRGWQVDVLDAHPGPAQGASALPVGMLSEHVTAHDTVMSELSRLGLALHLRELQAAVPMGHGWQPTQVSQLGPDHRTPELTLPAAMIRPSALVQAWLAQAQTTGLLRTHWGCAVARLARAEASTTGTGAGSAGPDDWQALDAHGRVMAQAPHVVVAAAFDSAALLMPHMANLSAGEPLRAVKGQMTWAPLANQPLAPHTLRDHGVFVPCYEDAAHPITPRLWTMGSTYERGLNDRTPTPEARERNARSLEAMCPPAAERLRQQHAAGELLDWAEVRCASLDRLPLVGAVPQPAPLMPSTQLAAMPRVDGLWTLCALGSRGLTLSKLAAELLVARLLGEPWPLEKRHADALDPGRFALKAVRKPSVTPSSK